MLRSSMLFKSVAVLIAAVAVLALPPYGQAQGTAALLKVLDQQIETKDFQQVPMTLSESLTMLVEYLEKKEGKELPVMIDTEAFRIDNPDAPDPRDAKVVFPPIPKKMTVAAALRYMLSRVDTKDATYVVLPDYILITTFNKAHPLAKLNEKVRGVFEKRPVHQALRELAESVGATLLIDTRVGDKAKTEVSATFLNDAELGSALRVLAEMAELKVVLLDATIIVTTPAQAEALRKEHRKMVEENLELNAKLEKMLLRGAFPLLIPTPSMVDPSVDPLWPYMPGRGRVGFRGLFF